ncbi:MAG: 3-methyl-2-oxobutanoate hydroxymethyltransferase [Candidatus Bipolaricaulota bacterium]|nr:3-methyl-2-oxobutanoate hydroxymethyltransferase [Candidatus Bipolaricaulota bacterium]
MRVTTSDIRKMKADGKRFSALTAYDAITARLLDEAGVPLLLVGDSLGMVVLGYENTIPVTLADILHHTRAVVRGTQRALVVADMPFMTYHRSLEQALENAGRCIQEGGAHAVKLEGGRAMAATIERLTSIGIPVLGHIGLTPQSVHQLGGFKVQGKTLDAARRLLDDAAAVEAAGAFGIVLECIPAEVARLITERLSIPTIGIGAGAGCDAQIQVSSDILGWLPDFTPKHTRPYAHLAAEAADAFRRFQEDVVAGNFPTEKESFSISSEVLAQLQKESAS